MNISTQSLIEFIVGLIGIISSAGGFAAWLTALSIRNDLTTTIKLLKQEEAVTRRRVKLLELFAVNNGFQREITLVGEDTDL